MMGDLHKLCYHSAQDPSLCYKGGGDKRLIYKVEPGAETTLTFAWGEDGKDLDICAFWDSAPDMKIGWHWNQTAGAHTTTVDGVIYSIDYSGDMRGTDDAEWVKVDKSSWSSGLNTLTIYLNFYSYDASTYPASTCTVIASQTNGPTKILENVNCGTRSGRRAEPGTDPYVTIAFDLTGKLVSVVQ